MVVSTWYSSLLSRFSMLCGNKRHSSKTKESIRKLLTDRKEGVSSFIAQLCLFFLRILNEKMAKAMPPHMLLHIIHHFVQLPINNVHLCLIRGIFKECACSAGDPGSIPGLGRSPGEGNGNPLQYSCLGNLMDRRAWQGNSLWGCRVRHDLATKQQQQHHF